MSGASRQGDALAATAGPRAWPVWVAAVAALVVLPRLFDSSFALTLLSQMAIFVVFALSYNMIFGQCGMLSFGHAVYSGLGAYGAVHALNALTMTPGGWSSPVTVALLPLVGGLTGALCGVLLGYPTTRRAGTPFAMITLGIGEMIHAAALMFPGLFGGEGGISTNRVAGQAIAGISFGPAIEVYYLIAAWSLVATALMYRFSLTPLGLIANAVRDNAERAEFIGYSARRVRYQVLIVSSFFAGIAGALGAINFELVTAENLSSLQSGAVLLAAFIGGTAWFAGPILGAIVYVLFALALSDYTPAWLLYLGLFFIAMVMYAPGGLAHLIDRNLTVVRRGRAGSLGSAYVAVIAAALALALPAIALIEMAYHRALDPTGETRVSVFGLGLDTAAGLSWLIALIAVTGAGLLFEQQRRRFVESWAAVWQQIDEGNDRGAEGEAGGRARQRPADPTRSIRKGP